MHSGSCLCGAVRYQISTPLGEVYFCHCRQCRKAQGSSAVASVPTPRASFVLLAGHEVLRAYRSSPHKQRWFCSHCGSAIYSEVDASATLRLRAGTLDDPITLTPMAHIFVAELPTWAGIHDALPQFPGREPGR